MSTSGSDGSLRGDDRLDDGHDTLPLKPDADAGPPAGAASGPSNASTTVSMFGDDTAASEVARAAPSDPLPMVPRKHYGSARELARGGLGRVSAARDLRLGREVAIKELHEHRGSARPRFMREVLITARLEHPSIVPIYEAGYWPDGSPFYAMKLLAGRTLGDLLDAAPSLSDRLSYLSSAIAVADAISYAHSKGVIHRDLKPSNVIVGDFGETVVVDWGLAKVIGEDDGVDQAPDQGPEQHPDQSPEQHPGQPGGRAGTRAGTRAGSRAGTRAGTRTGSRAGSRAGSIRHESGGDLTVAGTVLGTPRYMAPEQAAGEDVDERADIYALGAMLYHLCAGVAPHQGASPREVLYRLMLEAPAPLAERAPDTPGELVAIVDKAMARVPADRYASARELADDLRRFQNGQRVSVHHYSPGALFKRWLHRHRAIVIVAASLLALLVLTAVISVWRILEQSELARVRYVEAQAARESERERHHDLIVAYAAREHDATATLAWLKSLPRSASNWPQARLVAAEARNRGVARHVWRDHEGVVYVMALSPDGAWLATASQDRTAALRHLGTGQVVRLRGHAHWVHGVAFSPARPTNAPASAPAGVPTGAPADARPMVATSSKDGTVRLWDLDGNQLQVFEDHGGVAVNWIGFSPDGAFLATGDDAGAIRLRNLATGETRAMAGHAGRIWSMAFSPDGRWLASSSYAGDLRLWSVSGSEPERVLPAHPERVRQVSFSGDGRLLASVSQDRTVRLWDVATGALAATLAHPQGVMRARFSPDDRTLLTACSDGAIRAWDLASGQGRVLGQHRGAAHSVEIAPDGRLAASSGIDGVVRVWDVATGLEQRTYVGSRDMVTQVMFSRDGARLYSLGRSSGIREWSVAQRTVLHLPGPHGGGDAGAFSPDGATVAVGYDSGVVALWDVAAGQGAEIARHDGMAAAIAFSRDGAAIASGGSTGAVLLHARAGGATRALGRHEAAITELAFLPDGRLASASADGTLSLWRVDPGNEARAVLRGHQGPVHAVVAAADGRALFSGGADGTVRRWDVDSGAGEIVGHHGGAVRDLAISDDGTRLASAGEDQRVQVRRLDTGEVQVLTGHRHPVLQVSFAPGGRYLASLGSGASDVLVWDLVQGDSRRLAIEQTWGLAWFADGKRFVTSSEDTNVRLWDAGTGQGHVIDQHPARAADIVAIAADGTVVTVDRISELHIWRDDLPSDPAEVAGWLEQVTSAEITMGSFPFTPAAPP